MEKLIILGSGPAGLTAAIYSARANLTPVCIEGSQPGGQLTITTDVENYPGFPQGITGPELMAQFRAQAERFGTRFIQSEVSKVMLTKPPFQIECGNGVKLETRALIIATGASARWMGIESEKKFSGKGVSACATCDGFFFKNQDVAVVGGGDTALEEATFLTRFVKSVTLIHRRDAFRASKIMQEKARKNPKIRFLMDSVIEEISGAQTVERIRVKNVKTQTMQELPVQGVFVAIGHEPNTKTFKGQLPMNEAGYLDTLPNSSKTTIEGVFAAGDVADPHYRQAITSAGSGCMAAMDAERFLGE